MLFPAGAGLVASGAFSSSGVSDDGCGPVEVELDGGVVVAGGFIVSAGVSSVFVVGVLDVALVPEPVVLEVDGVLDAGAGSGPTSLGVGEDAAVDVPLVDVLVGALADGDVPLVDVLDGALADGDVPLVDVLVGSETGGFNVGFIVFVPVVVDVGAGSGPADFCDDVGVVADGLEPVDSAVAVDVVSFVLTGVPSEGAGMGDGFISVVSVGAGLTGTTGISLGTRVDSGREARWVSVVFRLPPSADEDSAGVVSPPCVHSPPCIGPSSMMRPSSTLFTCTREGRASSTVMRVKAW